MCPIKIREAMKKNPHHRLWDKPINKWTEKEKEEFENLSKKEKNIWKQAVSIKVERISDGKVYESISECRRQNGLCKVIMYRKLESGIEFRKINLNK